ncbi:O-antigen ligase family protein [Novosphingobium sp. M1R2S20]|uniref:O-antigen ligase family protein n=1 Tax=Novosphingobium rhizovicinum TaxID=3228928 RepID=A0ABV3RGB3_9SPHN
MVTTSPSADASNRAMYDARQLGQRSHIGAKAAPLGWTRIGSFLLAGAVFFSTWNLARVGTINFTLTDALLLCSLMILLAQGRVTATPFGSLTPFWVGGLLMMLSGLFVSSLVNGEPLRWLNVASQYAMAYLGVTMLMMSQDPNRTRRLCAVFVMGVTASEAIGVAASFFFTLDDVLPYFGDGFISGNGRVGAMAGEPNPNGASVAFAMPMLLYCLRERILSPIVGLCCAVILVWGLMLSASFTGFTATSLAALVTITLLGVRYLARLLLAVVIAASIFLASGAPLPSTFQERVGSAVESGDLNQAGTFVNRAELMEEAWHFAEDTAFIGMGVDQYRLVSAHDNPVHNLYLLIWNEGGIIAFAGLIAMLSMLLLLAVQGFRIRPREGAMAISVVIVFLIYTSSLPHMYSRNWAVPIMLALSTIYARRAVS